MSLPRGVTGRTHPALVRIGTVTRPISAAPAGRFGGSDQAAGRAGAAGVCTVPAVAGSVCEPLPAVLRPIATTPITASAVTASTRTRTRTGITQSAACSR